MRAGRRLSRPVMKAPESVEQEKTEQRLGNGKAREQKRPDRGQHSQRRVEAGAASPAARSPQPRQPGETEDGKGVGQVGGEHVLAEDPVGDGIEPVGQRRLFEVADAIELHGYPVAAFVHVLGDLGMRGIDVVEQRRSKERSELHGQKNGSQECPDGEL